MTEPLDPRWERLTPRQRRILRFAGEGVTTEEIAERLGIASATVRTHQQHILMKLDRHRMLDAVVLAVREGWI